MSATERTRNGDNSNYLLSLWLLYKSLFVSEEIVKKTLFILAAVILAGSLVVGCSAINAATSDPIVGSWQQSPSLGTTLTFTENPNNFTYLTGAIQTQAGTWTKSGSTYTLSGAIFGIITTTSVITPTFSNSNKTFYYLDSSNTAVTYNKQ